MVDRCRMSIQSICTDVQCTNWRIESGRLWRDGCFDSKTQQRVRRNTFTFTKCVPPFSMALNNSRRKTFFFPEIPNVSFKKKLLIQIYPPECPDLHYLYCTEDRSLAMPGSDLHYVVCPRCHVGRRAVANLSRIDI